MCPNDAMVPFLSAVYDMQHAKDTQLPTSMWYYTSRGRVQDVSVGL